MKSCDETSARDADPLDFPFQLDARIFFDALSHRLAEHLDVGSGGAATIDQEVAMQLRHLRSTDDQSAATRGIDQLPGFVAGRILEGRSTGAALDRLRRLARLGDLVHFGCNRRTVALPPLENRLGEDEILRRAAMPVG